MRCVAIEAREVRVGDRLVIIVKPRTLKKNVRGRTEVWSVQEVHVDDERVRIVVSGWYTVKHPREGVLVERELSP